MTSRLARSAYRRTAPVTTAAKPLVAFGRLRFGARGVLAGVLGLFVVCGTPAALGDSPGAARERASEQLLDDAISRVSAVRPRCSPAPQPGASPKLVEGGAGPLVTGAIAAFTRPPTQAELDVASAFVQDNKGSNGFGFATVGREGARTLTAADGTQLSVIAAQTTFLAVPTAAKAKACEPRLEHAIRALAKTPAQRRARPRALQLAHKLTQGEIHTANTFTSGEGLATESSDAAYSGDDTTDDEGGPFDLNRFEHGGGLRVRYTDSGASNIKDDRTQVSITEVVPNDVARVRYTLQAESLTRDNVAPNPAEDITRSVTVQDNLVSLKLPFSHRTARYPVRTDYYAADGHLLRISRRS